MEIESKERGNKIVEDFEQLTATVFSITDLEERLDVLKIINNWVVEEKRTTLKLMEKLAELKEQRKLAEKKLDEITGDNKK